MLDFQRGPKPRNYLARREQWRLLGLVLLLGLAVTIIVEPDIIASAWRATVEMASRETEKPPVDTRPPLEPIEEEVPGTFRAPGEKPAEEGPASEGDFSIPARYLDEVRDDAPFRPAEREAWYRMLSALRDADSKAVDRASTGKVTYVQLFDQPEVYRGKLVTVRGTIRRAELLHPPENSRGITEYYRLVVRPSDNPRDPLVLYSLGLPEGFPTGEGVDEEVSVTGYFFKRWEYLSEGGLLTAPVMLSKTVHWIPTPEVVAKSPSRGPALWARIALAAAFALLVAMYVYYRTRRGGSVAEAGSPAARMFSRREPPADVDRDLRELAKKERSGDG